MPVLSQLQLKDSKQCVRKVIAATKNKSLIASSLLAGVTVCGSPTCSVQKKLSDNRIITHGIGPWLMFLFSDVIVIECNIRHMEQLPPEEDEAERQARYRSIAEENEHVNRVSGQNGW